MKKFQIKIATPLQNQFLKGNNFTLSVPASLVPGNYFLRVITENLRSNTVKILVIN